jgi:CYTH domain-containing protein
MDHLDHELMSGMEIERKYLVHKQKNWKELAVSSSHIQQGYMAAVNTVRIRIRDEKAFLTIKGKSVNGGLSRYEFEKEISTDEALQLLKLCEPPIIDKYRYLIPFEGHTFEVDEFHGANEGLLFAEVELKDENEAYERPPFLGPEVTGNRHFYNSHLLSDPYPNWKDELPEEYQ